MALNFLSDLPSRGLLTAVQSGSAFVSAPAPYIADHNTAPPPDQVVKTDPTSLLIKSLQRKARGEPRKKAPARPAGASDSGKRPAEGAADGDGGQAKRAAAGPSSGAGAGPSSGAGPSGSGPSILPPAQAAYTLARLRAKTVKDLQAILKAWGLPVSGKKEDLVGRIMEKQEAAQGRR